MTPTTTVPFTITNEAAAYIRKLGLQAELDRMIEHTKQAVPGLLKIHVRVAEPCDPGDFDAIIIDAVMHYRHLDNDPTGWEWNEWVVRNFPPKAHQYFTLMLDYEELDAR